MVSLVTFVVFNLSQILVTHLFIFFNSGSIDISGRSIGCLASRSFMTQTRVFLVWPTWGLTKLAWLTLTSTFTITLVSDMRVRGLLSLRILLVPRLFALYQFVPSRTVLVALSSKRKRLIICYGLSINSPFDNFLLIVYILILFVQLDINRKSQAILEVPY